MNSEDKIREVGNEVIELLVSKNKAYGDSALKPANIFAKGDAVQNLCSRIDDKLMRIANSGLDDSTEDTVQDLIGYLILLKIALHDRNKQHNGNDNTEHQGNGKSLLYQTSSSTISYPEWKEQIIS